MARFLFVTVNIVQYSTVVINFLKKLHLVLNTQVMCFCFLTLTFCFSDCWSIEIVVLFIVNLHSLQHTVVI